MSWKLEMNTTAKGTHNIFHCRHNKFAFGDKFFLMGVFAPLKVPSNDGKTELHNNILFVQTQWKGAPNTIRTFRFAGFDCDGSHSEMERKKALKNINLRLGIM